MHIIHRYSFRITVYCVVSERYSLCIRIVFSSKCLDPCFVSWMCLLDNPLALIFEIYCVLTSACLLDFDSLDCVCSTFIKSSTHGSSWSLPCCQNTSGCAAMENNQHPSVDSFSITWAIYNIKTRYVFFFLRRLLEEYSSAYCTNAPIGID